jgi:hypothetical protein
VPHLTIRDGDGERVFRIEGDMVTVGRASTNTVALHEMGASKEHCRLERVGDRWKLVDLESKNGTKINGEVRNKAWLAHDDRIEIGKSELRFVLEGAQRPASGKRAPAGSGAAPRRPGREAGDDAHAPPPRRRRAKQDNVLIAVLATLGTVVVFLIGAWAYQKLAPDHYNEGLLVEAQKLMDLDQWQEAQDYLQKNADPDGNMYEKVQIRIREIQERKDAFYKARRNEEALKIYSRMARYVQAYNRGSVDVTPEEIQAFVNRLKTDYADTEHTERARKEFPAWFQGYVPQRAIELIDGGRGSLADDWEEALRRSRDFENDNQYREAREAVERFLTVREVSMTETQVNFYKGEIEKARKHLELAAQNAFFGIERRANGLARQGRYDEAIELMRNVARTFGLDAYTAKAQQAIDRYTKDKAAGG